ncbi:oligosaccharide flippase family protein [Amycolatopsis viridis]|uniref:O-antigen/teichoic acid export membrane protein n=1 Tax=Amycolatopsis viridis TaxID=185678 RepID=A0ABX0SZ48_9PSEU|nr:polysaccharide biosynthesis C-terminal domain-containing protein [Amycolatopsis viridis]NIH80860.1 O-antigen/teichoic acid export membrane protein [Amycolatopsis viridis]
MRIDVPGVARRWWGTGAGGPFGRRGALLNLTAQGTALLIVAVASVLVARIGGPTVLGEYTLLRVLPWLFAVVFSCGLPVASTFFMAGGYRDDARLRPTLTVLAVLGASIATGLWLVAAPLLHRELFTAAPLRLVALMAATVVTQLLTVWGKACCQGAADMRGANLVIVCEELLFLPAYGIAGLAGLRGLDAVVAGMIAGGAAAAGTALGRLAATGFFRHWKRPHLPLGFAIMRYGARGQLGNLLMLVNLRLDFVILGVLAGPAVVGVYAVASKFAELMRLPATALNYVLYPRFARQKPAAADADVQRLLPRAVAGTAAMTPLLAVASVITLPVLYGPAFRSAVLPACILLAGLAVEGAAAVSSAYLCGRGRPGANSWGMGAGALVTVALDVVLIPRAGAVGAAIASTVAYLVTTGLLTTIAQGLARRSVAAVVADGGEPA